jgi:hypothetical protein
MQGFIIIATLVPGTDSSKSLTRYCKLLLAVVFWFFFFFSSCANTYSYIQVYDVVVDDTPS